MSEVVPSAGKGRQGFSLLQQILTILVIVVCSTTITTTKVAATTAVTEEHPSADVIQVRDQLDSDGYVVLRNFFREQAPLLQEWKSFSEVYFYRVFEQLHKEKKIVSPKPIQVELSDDKRSIKSAYYTMETGPENGYSEIVHRFPGRYELSLQRSAVASTTNKKESLLLYDMPDLDPIVNKLKPYVLSIFKQHPMVASSSINTKNPQNEFDTEEFNLIYSFLISTTGSKEQRWHTDSGHLSDDEYLPSHCFNVFIPLVDITMENGPTDLVKSSHIQTLDKNRGKKFAVTANDAIAPELNVGDALLFDFRTLHRGLANKSTINRPILVLTFSIPSFTDTLNWPIGGMFD